MPSGFNYNATNLRRVLYPRVNGKVCDLFKTSLHKRPVLFVLFLMAFLFVF